MKGGEEDRWELHIQDQGQIHEAVPSRRHGRVGGGTLNRVNQRSCSASYHTAHSAAQDTTAQASWRDKANSELQKIVPLFSSKQLPDMCAKAIINAPAKPSSKWSFGNQLLMLLAGTTDARGFRQWNEVGRSVSKGSKAFFILGACQKESQEESTWRGGRTAGRRVSRNPCGFQSDPRLPLRGPRRHESLDC